jgi:hypothetical protein
MSIVERLYAPISERPSPDAAIDASTLRTTRLPCAGAPDLQLDLGSKHPSPRVGSEQKSSRFRRGSEQPIGPLQPRRRRDS